MAFSRYHLQRSAFYVGATAIVSRWGAVPTPRRSPPRVQCSVSDGRPSLCKAEQPAAAVRQVERVAHAQPQDADAVLRLLLGERMVGRHDARGVKRRMTVRGLGPSPAGGGACFRPLGGKCSPESGRNRFFRYLWFAEDTCSGTTGQRVALPLTLIPAIRGYPGSAIGISSSFRSSCKVIEKIS